jgi:hypothetical protein
MHSEMTFSDPSSIDLDINTTIGTSGCRGICSDRGGSGDILNKGGADLSAGRTVRTVEDSENFSFVIVISVSDYAPLSTLTEVMWTSGAGPTSLA